MGNPRYEGKQWSGSKPWLCGFLIPSVPINYYFVCFLYSSRITINLKTLRLPFCGLMDKETHRTQNQSHVGPILCESVRVCEF